MRDKVPMVAEQLICDSILGVDALVVFGAVMKEGVATETVKTMSEERLDRPAEIVEAPKPEIPPDKGMEADFSDWALILTTGYVVTYSLLSGYDLMETVCLGWFGVRATGCELLRQERSRTCHLKGNSRSVGGRRCGAVWWC
ncbi:hypothetical protein PF001_g31845 [Phytophthora fragariae]|uniref:Uncharacterized protein n=1 Tax=Phytophthora fragariae TaxID=53985 RepID=A0A6A4AS28_9STRA|nr:hypothetical protein PF001_g31845 [Phytophthora fragariae]